MANVSIEKDFFLYLIDRLHEDGFDEPVYIHELNPRHMARQLSNAIKLFVQKREKQAYNDKERLEYIKKLEDALQMYLDAKCNEKSAGIQKSGWHIQDLYEAEQNAKQVLNGKM